ncbi:MAG: hypothetical protein EXR75_10395 [Myxococcales bacterium]|nr:hypothetical protein [Myxococcales bacterium]
MLRSRSRAEPFAALGAGRIFFVLCCGVWLGACATSRPLEIAVRASFEEGPRRPDAIVVDPSSDPPSSESAGDTSTAIVTLRTPLPMSAALATVAAFFAGVVREDLSSLHEFGEATATVSDIGNSPPRVLNLFFVWQQRFQQFDYGELDGSSIYREAEVRTFRPEEVHALPRRVAAAVLAEPLAPEDLVLVVPITAPAIKNQRVFGDELTFILRRAEARFRIFRMIETTPR